MRRALRSAHVYLCLSTGQPIPSWFAACPLCGGHVDETTHPLMYQLPLPRRVPYRRGN